MQHRLQRFMLLAHISASLTEKGITRKGHEVQDRLSRYLFNLNRSYVYYRIICLIYCREPTDFSLVQLFVFWVVLQIATGFDIHICICNNSYRFLTLQNVCGRRLEQPGENNVTADVNRLSYSFTFLHMVNVGAACVR